MWPVSSLTLTLSAKNRKENRKWKENKKETKSTSCDLDTTQIRRKILSRNKYFIICHKRDIIPGTGRKIKTDCILVKNNASSRNKLQDIQQRTISYCKSSKKIRTIPIRYYRKVWSLNRLWKSQVLQRAT